MFRRIADNRDEQSMAVRFRRKRFAFFLSLLSQLERPVRVLDIGGTEGYWKTMGLDATDQVFITLLNLSQDNVTLPYLTSIVGDARNLDMKDNSFDIVFSNSVIEHVGGHQDQMQMAKEVHRVGRCYFVQTPNKYFPLEPHFLFPFFQFLPIRLRVFLLRNFNLGWFKRTPNAQEAREAVESIRLLTKREFAALFPDALIYEEKILWMTKSFVAYAGWDK